MGSGKTEFQQLNIKDREELQKKVLRHSNRLINELLKKLDDAEHVVHKRLSPMHLEKLICHLRDDITPLKYLIVRISEHAERLGSMKRDEHLRYARTRRRERHRLEVMRSNSDSDTTLTKYMIGRGVRDDIQDRSRTKLRSTSRGGKEREESWRARRDFRSRSCSPIQFAGDHVVESVIGQHLPEVSDLMDPQKHPGTLKILFKAFSKTYTKVFSLWSVIVWVVSLLRNKLTDGERRSPGNVFLIAVFSIFSLYIFGEISEYGFNLVRAYKGLRRGIKPM